MQKIALPTVTLCAAASVNVQATAAALRACLDPIDFGECILFTDAVHAISDAGIRGVSIPRLGSAQAYSEFLLRHLADHISTEHCLLVQWDGFVLDARAWDPSFLTYDYIGAPWPQFSDGQDVGNGGFSLRSHKLLSACQDPLFRLVHPEDLAICRLNRSMLEQQHGIRIADRETAERFAFERSPPRGATFGFHGIFNLVPALGPDRFWEIYGSLDDRRTAFVDFNLLMQQIGTGSKSLQRRTQLTLDLLKNRFGSMSKKAVDRRTSKVSSS